MPTAPAKPTEAEKPAEEPTLTDKLYAQYSAIPEPERSFPEQQIVRAIELERQRGNLMKQVNANRTFLRTMDEAEALDDEQADWLEIFYPTKEKDSQRSKDEVEQTRKARESARRVK